MAQPAGHKELTERRRVCLLGILELESEGASIQRIYDVAKELHAHGDWPNDDEINGRKDPYQSGINQHLQSMVERGRVVRIRGGWDAYLRGESWHTFVYFHPTVAKMMAHRLLPEGEEREECEAALRDLSRNFAEVALGVTPELVRVVRVMTGRGPIDFPVETAWIIGINAVIEELT